MLPPSVFLSFFLSFFFTRNSDVATLGTWMLPPSDLP
jgi:hypothetical protein